MKPHMRLTNDIMDGYASFFKVLEGTRTCLWYKQWFK